MFDLLVVFFTAMRFSVIAIISPSPDKRIRRFQYVALLCSAVGVTMFVAGVVHIIRFDFKEAAGFCLLILGAAFCGIAGCTGIMIEKDGSEEVDSR